MQKSAYFLSSINHAIKSARNSSDSDALIRQAIFLYMFAQF